MKYPLSKEKFLLAMPVSVRVAGDWKKREVWVNGKLLSLYKSLRVEKISLTGFNWGYFGTGPAQLALAVLLEFVDPQTAREYHQLLKFNWVGTLPQRNFQGDFNLYSVMERALEELEKGFVIPHDTPPIKVTREEYEELVAAGTPDIERYRVVPEPNITQVNDISDEAKQYFIDKAWEDMEKELVSQFGTTYSGDEDVYIEDSTPAKSIMDFFKTRTRPV